MGKIKKLGRYNVSSLIDFDVNGTMLHIKLQANKVLVNMQEDAVAFEGWAICFKAHEAIDKVEISVDQLHELEVAKTNPQVNQLIYRLWKFQENYIWASLEKKLYVLVKSKYETLFIEQKGKIVLNYPKSEAAENAHNVEAQLERLFVAAHSNENNIMGTQMPFGLFHDDIKENNRILPTTYIDIWSNHNNELNIYELKAKGNKSIGILSELMYYCYIISDRRKNKLFQHSSNAYKYAYRKLDTFLNVLDRDSDEINVNGVFLTDTLHPLIEQMKDEIKGILDGNHLGVSFLFETYKDTISCSSDYQEIERDRQTELISSRNDVFYGAQAAGYYKGYKRPFCLKKGNEDKNLYSGIVKSVKTYFDVNQISFWGNGRSVPNHILSSQVSCLNHLFAIRDNEEIVKAVAQKFVGCGIKIRGVEKLKCDSERQEYIAFEVVSKKDHLNELGNKSQLKRGEYCTSIDAVILAKTNKGNLLIPIEWKYTETYNRADKSKEDNPYKPTEPEAKGQERLNRYQELIEKSDYLRHLGLDNYRGSTFFQEPFYQLMRQTLWAEQMIRNKDKEVIKADDYIHVHVVPKDNKALLNQGFEWGDSMENVWKEQLNKEGRMRYKLVDPSDVLNAIQGSNNEGKYNALISYIKDRYNE